MRQNSGGIYYRHSREGPTYSPAPRASTRREWHLPRRIVFSRVNESLEEDIANMRTLLAESTKNLEATRRERDTFSRKHQELSQDCQRRHSLLKKQDIIALREDVNRLRDKYDEAREKLRDTEDAYGSLESVIDERESTILDLRSQTDRLNSELVDA